MANFLSDTDSLAKKASRLHLSALTLAENIKNGNFKSIFKGQGIEFSGVREYLPGDNVRSIDWNVTARMGRPYIKLYEEDKEIQIFIILDKSASMFSGSGGKSKILSACNAAALLILAAEQNSSAVGGVFFDGKIQFSCRPQAGLKQAMMILSKLDDEIPVSEAENGSALETAISGAEKMLRKKSLVFVISDFRVSGWQKSFARLALKNDVIALRITDPMDSSLPKTGTVAFEDPETRKVMKIPTSSAKFAEKWFEGNRRRIDLWQEFCLHHGAFPLMLSTTEEPSLVLSKFFKKRGRK